MKKVRYIFWILILALSSCKDDDNTVFEKTADERVSEAIADLKDDLTSPPNGWKLKYKPEIASGSFYVFLTFEEDNKVNIRTDLGANDGEFFNQTITYRIDNSLGLELIMENYCFFSFLFEQNSATFGAEFEFNFVNKTPDDALVFRSKTDFSNPTILVFEEAASGEADALLGTAVSENLNIMAADLDNFTPSIKLTYLNKDLLFFISLDNSVRTINFTSAARKSNNQNTQSVNFSTPYVIKGDSIVFDSPLSGNYLGNNITIKSIKLNSLSDIEFNVCPDPIPAHAYAGVTSANDAITLETSLLDINGVGFTTLSDFYVAPLGNIFNNGQSAGAAIAQDITGAQAMQLYYNFDLSGTPFYAIGFFIQNANGTVTFALRQFTPVLTGNNIVFNFAPDISIFGSQQTDANIQNVNIYLNALSDGGDTYVFEFAENLYEFFNPCTGWSFVFVNANQ
jgi:hypothetical protein